MKRLISVVEVLLCLGMFVEVKTTWGINIDGTEIAINDGTWAILHSSALNHLNEAFKNYKEALKKYQDASQNYDNLNKHSHQFKVDQNTNLAERTRSEAELKRSKTDKEEYQKALTTLTAAREEHLKTHKEIIVHGKKLKLEDLNKFIEISKKRIETSAQIIEAHTKRTAAYSAHLPFNTKVVKEVDRTEIGHEVVYASDELKNAGNELKYALDDILVLHERKWKTNPQITSVVQLTEELLPRDNEHKLLQIDEKKWPLALLHAEDAGIFKYELRNRPLIRDAIKKSKRDRRFTGTEMVDLEAIKKQMNTTLSRGREIIAQCPM